MIYGSRDLKIYEVSSYNAQKEHKKGTVWAFPAVQGVYISPSTYNKSIFAAILRAQPTFREIWKIMQFCHYICPKNKKLYFYRTSSCLSGIDI